MRYSQLRAFHNVALHGGFSRAAQALNQTQPALSDQVRKLEQEHDTLLFHRDRKQVRLTAAGEGLFRMTRQFFEQEDAMEDYLTRSRALIDGTLRIVADSVLHITGAISRFRESYPGVFLSVQTGNTAEVLEKLRNYDAEVGVVGNAARAHDLDTVSLGQTPITAIAAKGTVAPGTKAIFLADLAGSPLVFREPGSRTRQSLEREAQRRGISLKPVIEVDGREAMREVVASGAGIGFVSEAEFGHDARLIRVPVADIDLTMAEMLVCLSMRRDLPVIRAFMRSVEDA